MGIYSDYLNNLKDFQDIIAERKKQLARISVLRGSRDVLVYASDVQKGKAPILIDYTDILPIKDQIENLDSGKIDVILETPGGYAEIAEDIVKLLRNKFSEVAFIIPGMAKSAGTIIVMSGNEILMEPASSLGPIDAQIFNQGKAFSADAFLEGLDKIKEEVKETGQLNKAYIPILQGISPGEIQSCENALNFSQKLVSNWLEKYKFKTWIKHSSTGAPVTEEERKARATEVAKELCDHGFWLTHGRSIKIADFERMRLLITDYSKNQELYDAIKRYYILLRMTFEGSSNIYKIFETPLSQIYRYQGLILTQKQIAGEVALIDFQCGKCQNVTKIQANLDKDRPLEKGAISFPKDNLFKCPQCGTENNLMNLRNEVESQSKKKIV